jgi:hypothetical protein
MNKASILLILFGFFFDACCNGDFIIPTKEEPVKDFRETAVDVTNLINDCSPDEAYTTMDGIASPHGGSCWDSTPLFTKWFKFKAPASTDATIILQVGDGEFGTQRRSFLALWDTDGTTELDCATYSIFGVDDATINIYHGNLTPDAVYYFSVDVKDAQSRGTFKLCLTDSD